MFFHVVRRFCGWRNGLVFTHQLNSRTDDVTWPLPAVSGSLNSAHGRPGESLATGFPRAAGLIGGAAPAAGRVVLQDCRKRGGDVGGLTSYSETATADNVFCFPAPLRFHFRLLASGYRGRRDKTSEPAGKTPIPRPVASIPMYSTLYFSVRLADGFGLESRSPCLSLMALQNAKLCPGDNRRCEHHTPGAVAAVRRVVSHPDRAGAERVVGERRKVLHSSRLSTMQRCKSSNGNTDALSSTNSHINRLRVVDAVFALELLQIDSVQPRRAHPQW